MKKDLLEEIEDLKSAMTIQGQIIETKDDIIMDLKDSVVLWKKCLDRGNISNDGFIKDGFIKDLKDSVVFWMKQTKNSQEDAAFWRKKTCYWMEQAGVLTPEKISKESGTLIQFKPKMINKKLAIMG